jgi:hypothetical protein
VLVKVAQNSYSSEGGYTDEFLEILSANTKTAAGGLGFGSAALVFFYDRHAGQ